MEILLLVAAVVVLVGGVAVVLVNRRDDSPPGIEPPARGPAGTSAFGGAPAEVRSGTREESELDRELAHGHAPVPGVEGTPEQAHEVAEATSPAAEPVVRPTFRDRLTKARSTFSTYLGSMLSRSDITEETWEELEEALIRADVGVGLTTRLLDDLRATVKAQGITEPQALVDALKVDLTARLEQGDRTLTHEPGNPNVWLFVGVNGVGKTTSIGKVGKQQVAEGRSVIMAAGDTFRAAAAEQLETWAGRAGAEFHRGAEGGDPSSVIFDAIQKAGARDIELVLADTAGRLHTKSNLMEELAKVRRVADRDPGNVTEVLLVLDATTGQNGLQQAKQFTEATQCTGVVLTKLDGSAKGGIALAIALDEEMGGLGLPIKLVGLGESADDLIEFEPAAFVDALLDAVIWLLWKLLTLPFRLVGGVLRVVVGTIRFVGVDRIAAFGAGVAAGTAMAPKPAVQLQGGVARREEQRAARGGDIGVAVRHELATSPRTWHLPQPGVTVHGDRVRLTGTVPHEQARLDLLRTAGAIAGVRAVDDDLTVEPDGDTGGGGAGATPA